MHVQKKKKKRLMWCLVMIDRVIYCWNCRAETIHTIVKRDYNDWGIMILNACTICECAFTRRGTPKVYNAR